MYKVDGQRLTAKQEGTDLLGLGLKTGDMVTKSYLPWRLSRSRLYGTIYKDGNLILIAVPARGTEPESRFGTGGWSIRN